MAFTLPSNFSQLLAGIRNREINPETCVDLFPNINYVLSDPNFWPHFKYMHSPYMFVMHLKPFAMAEIVHECRRMYDCKHPKKPEDFKKMILKVFESVIPAIFTLQRIQCECAPRRLWIAFIKDLFLLSDNSIVDSINRISLSPVEHLKMFEQLSDNDTKWCTRDHKR